MVGWFRRFRPSPLFWFGCISSRPFAFLFLALSGLALGVYLCVCVCVVCVCAEHLNRCKTSSFLYMVRKCWGCQGCTLDWHRRRRHCVICDIDLGRWIDVPAFSPNIILFPLTWHGAKPRTPYLTFQFMLCTFAAIWYLNLFIPF